MMLMETGGCLGFIFDGSIVGMDGGSGLKADESRSSGLMGSFRSHSSKSFSDFWSACGVAIFVESGCFMRFLFSTSCALTIMARASSESIIRYRQKSIQLHVS